MLVYNGVLMYSRNQKKLLHQLPPPFVCFHSLFTIPVYAPFRSVLFPFLSSLLTACHVTVQALCNNQHELESYYRRRTCAYSLLMRANKLETSLSRDRNIACLAPPDVFFCSWRVHVPEVCAQILTQSGLTLFALYPSVLSLPWILTYETLLPFWRCHSVYRFNGTENSIGNSFFVGFYSVGSYVTIFKITNPLLL